MTLLQRLFPSPAPANYRWQYFQLFRPDGKPEKRPVQVKLLGSDVSKDFFAKCIFGRYRLPVSLTKTSDCLYLGSNHGYFLMRDTTKLQEQTVLNLLPGADLSVCCDDLDEGPTHFSLECENFSELVEGYYFPEVSSQACLCDLKQRPPGNIILHLDFPPRYGCKSISYYRWTVLTAGETLHWVISRETVERRVIVPPQLSPGQKVTLIMRSLPDDAMPPVHWFTLISKMLSKEVTVNRFKHAFEEYIYHDYPVPPDRILRLDADPNCRYLLITDGKQLLSPMQTLNA